MPKKKNRKIVVDFLIVTWVATVLGSYYFYNVGYYEEKISVFWGFLSRFII